jgi:hypothetical protein
MPKLPGMPPFGQANWSAPQAVDIKRIWDDIAAAYNILVDDGTTAYTVLNVTPTRTGDALGGPPGFAPLMNLLGTLILDLKAKGIIT